MQTTERTASKPSPALEIKPIGRGVTENWLRSKLQEVWSGRFVVTRGVQYEPANLPGFIAYENGKPIGVATYHINDAECELITLDALSAVARRWQCPH